MTHRAKKSLGQNFLKSDLAIRKIIEAGKIQSSDVVLEIGPGKGKLTEKLLEHAGLVIAVEKDRDLFEFLKIKFARQIEAHTLVLVHGDILEFDIGDYLSSTRLRYKIIANIPYNITGAILKKFLTEENQPSLMVLMIQHEVAQRIMARDKKESVLSISVKMYGEPKVVIKVPARYFSPAPKVDSAALAINNISRKIFDKNSIKEEKFWEIVKKGFAHKRKKLSGNLKGIIFKEKYLWEDLKGKRAEDLSLPEWISLVKSAK